MMLYKLPSNYLLLLWIPLTLLLLSNTVVGVDPVYSPQALSDSSGNSADADSIVTWTDLPAGDPYTAENPVRVSTGLEPYYNLVHSFIGSVFSKGIPYDVLDLAIAGNFSTITTNYSEYTSYFIGYAICVVLGILFMLIFPIIACCFCGCRCCGNCGGKMHQDEKMAGSACRKYTYAAILFIAIVFLVVGAICIYLNNQNTSTTINSIADVTNQNLHDVKVFFNNTQKEATHIARTNFDFLKLALFRDLDNIGYLVGLPLRTDIETQTGIQTTLTNALALETDITAADDALTDVETNLDNLNTSITDLNTALTGVRDTLDGIFTTCDGTCPTPRPDYSGASSGVATSNFPNLNGPRTSMNQAKTTNLTAEVIKARGSLEDIPERVVNDSLSSRNSMVTTINNLADDIDPMIDQITDLNNQISGENATIDLDKLSDDIEGYGDTISTYDKYRWYGGIALASIVLLVVLFAVLGLFLGMCGSSLSTPPQSRGSLSNCGGICLMWSVAFVFIFALLIMLLTLLTFMLGAPIHRFICEPIADLDQLEKLIELYGNQQVGAGNYFLGDALLSNKTVPLTVSGMLKGCRDGQPALEAFKLDTKFDINDLLNYSKTLDVQAEIDNINIDFSSTNVYPAALQTQLNDINSAIDVNFTQFYDELNNSPTSTDLNTLANEIDTYAAAIPDPYKTNLTDEATKLRAIDANEKADVQSKITTLNSSVATMESTVNAIPPKITALDTGLTTADTYIQTNASAVVSTILNTYVTRILSIVDSYVAYTQDAVFNKMGKCEPVWNFYNSMMIHLFCYNMMDTFNGFWFSLGWCIFFFMFSLIFSVKTAKYFRTMKDQEGANKPGYKGYASGPVVEAPNPWKRKNRVGHYDNQDWHGPDTDDFNDAYAENPANNSIMNPNISDGNHNFEFAGHQVTNPEAVPMDSNWGTDPNVQSDPVTESQGDPVIERQIESDLDHSPKPYIGGSDLNIKAEIVESPDSGQLYDSQSSNHHSPKVTFVDPVVDGDMSRSSPSPSGPLNVFHTSTPEMITDPPKVDC